MKIQKCSFLLLIIILLLSIKCMGKDMPLYYDQARVDELQRKHEYNDPFEEKFYNQYLEWKLYCHKPEIYFSSVSWDRAQGKAFKAIVNMGNTALPYIFNELKRGDLFLVHAIEKIMNRRYRDTSLNCCFKK